MRYRHKKMGVIFENLGWVKFIDKKQYVLKVIKHPDNPNKSLNALLQSAFLIGSIIFVEENSLRKYYTRLRISEYKKGDILFKKYGDVYVYWGMETQLFRNEIKRKYVLKVSCSENGIPGELKYFEPEDIDSCDIDQIEEPYGRVKITKSFGGIK
ncbi:hypothetical protein ACTQX5_02560 [Faecalicoccus sp. LCP19S3_E3]|uniref:hypothetical protein n=1 Tax=unclassified Faecalicoccus TaxID=2643311 RepID=UPI003F91469B